MNRPYLDPPHDTAPTGALRAQLRFSREEAFRLAFYGPGRSSLENPSRQFKRAYARKMDKLETAAAKREALKRRH